MDVYYRDKKVVGVFVVFRAPLHPEGIPTLVNWASPFNFKKKSPLVCLTMDNSASLSTSIFTDALTPLISRLLRASSLAWWSGSLVDCPDL
jgi:hypothetical protein